MLCAMKFLPIPSPFLKLPATFLLRPFSKGMTIGLLLFDRRGSGETMCYSNRRFFEAAEQASATMHRYYLNDFAFFPSPEGVTVRYLGQLFTPPDIMIVRPGNDDTGSYLFLMDLLEQAGCRFANRMNKLGLVKHKLRQKWHMNQHNIPTPDWAVARVSDQAMEAAKTIGFPHVMKLPFGSRGNGVMFIPDEKTLKPMAEFATRTRQVPVFLETFIKEASCQDMRVFVVHGEVCASMRRIALPDDIRSNASIGGTGEVVAITEEERALAIRTAEVFDLDIAGVDIIRSEHGPLVLEINANPGFEELEHVTGVDVASAMIQYAISLIPESKQSSRTHTLRPVSVTAKIHA